MTADEELNLLDEAIRRLKIEYDVYFGGGSKRPPTDTEWRVQAMIKRLETPKLSFPQRFRYNSIVQKHAIYSDLWRQKLKIKEEGYRRPQDALLAIQGLRDPQRSPQSATARPGSEQSVTEAFRIVCTDADREQEAVRSLFVAMMEAKRKAGENVPESTFESFRTFVKRKTEQIRKQYHCPAVEYAVEAEGGQVRLKAKAQARVEP